MTRADELRQYATEAMGWALQSKTKSEELTHLDIARTWLRAAALRDGILHINVDHPVPDARAA